MKKILIIATVLAGTLLFAFWFNFTSNKANEAEIIVNEPIKSSQEQPQNIERLVAHQHLHVQPKSKELSAATGDDVKTIESIDEQLQETAFSRSETAEQVLQASGKLRENLQGEVYLELDNEHISSLEAGDTLALDVPFFDMYQNVEIESTKIDSRGNKTLNAKFWMNDDLYNTTITINDHAIYGHIETPHGTYSVAGDGQYAWMAESQDLVRGAVPDQIGGNAHDGSADPQPITEPKPIEITGK